ncbi:MAG: TRAP transporter substrate-binding protein [Alphaproteobacteria bacterium]
MTLRKTTAALAGAAAILAVGMPAANAQVVMKMASATVNDVQHEFQKVFAEELAARVGDAVTVEIYPASQLGAIPRMVEGVLFGTIESFITPTSFLVGTDPRFAAFDTPGLFADGAHVGRVIHDPEYRRHLEGFAQGSGLRIIGVIYNSPILVLSTTPIETLADFDGLKIRTFATPLQMEPMTSVGASPTPLALTEVIPALQSGGIDGMLAGMPILTAFKYWDVAEYVTDLNFATVISVNVVNEAWFQSQPQEIRTAIREAGRAAEAQVLQWGIDNVAAANQLWLDNGGQILTLPAEEQAQMEADFAAIAEAFLHQDGAVWAEYESLRDMAAARREAE